MNVLQFRFVHPHPRIFDHEFHIQLTQLAVHINVSFGLLLLNAMNQTVLNQRLKQQLQHHIRRHLSVDKKFNLELIRESNRLNIAIVLCMGDLLLNRAEFFPLI
ncbi:hypothetical protein D3C85_1063660 [compost metagenome]